MSLRARLDQLRRHLEERVDQAWALSRHLFAPRDPAPTFDGDPRFAIVTVNFSTTRYLKLLLLTLAEQKQLSRVTRVVVVDNDSRDGGPDFLRALASRVDRITLLENRVFLTHARGMRHGIRSLHTLDTHANIVLSIDTDVVFRRDDALDALAKVFTEQHAAIAGELRRGVYPQPEAQASFLAVRRDLYARRDITPWVNHGAPAYWLQRSAARAGLTIVDFPTYRGGYALHRGRSGVAAARAFDPSSSYASVENAEPHFMGVPEGAAAWAEIEARWSHLLERDEEAALIAHLASRFASAK